MKSPKPESYLEFLARSLQTIEKRLAAGERKVVWLAPRDHSMRGHGVREYV